MWTVATTVTKRAYRYRCYPNAEQAAELSRTFGCVRLVYNKALEARTASWQQERRRVNYCETSALLTEWKRTEDLGFLSDVSSVPLQQCLRHLQVAFTNFFARRARHPRFKSRKRGRESAEYTRSAFRWHDNRLTLAKMTEPLDIRWSRPLPPDSRPSTVTVSRDAAGRWHVSILVETKIAHLPVVTGEVGVDMGLMTLATLEGLPLHARTWTCATCRTTHDRDVNAAMNILAAGRAVAACGGGVRPCRR